jgi:chorismate-pyruvate lyase
MRNLYSFSLFACLVPLFSPGSASADARKWPDGFLTRVELLALIQTLNASLLAGRSATATLEQWCADHRMAETPKIVAKRMSGADRPPSPETKERLGVGAGEAVAYRRVQLICGGHILSEADNWYVPGRLTPDMNRVLETTETPFGKVVAPLHPFRRTIEMKMRWSPLPEGWELVAGPETGKEGGALSLPREIFEHTAILYGPDQKPFSEVHETYTGETLDFAPGGAAKRKD